MEENHVSDQEISHGKNSRFSYYSKQFPLPIQLISLRKLLYAMLAKEVC